MPDETDRWEKFKARASDSVVFYHGDDCADGFTAAWSAWTVLGYDAEYIPMTYADNEVDPSDFSGMDVYVLDFSFPRQNMIEVADEASRMVVLDHHDSVRKECEGLPFCRFESDMSGAGMAWDHFREGEDVPPIVRYVEDRDLWKFDLPASEEVNAAVASYPKTFEKWSQFRHMGREFAKNMASEGRAILRSVQQRVDHVCEETRILKVPANGDVLRVPSANCPIHRSEVGGKLARRSPDGIGAVWFLSEGKVKVSLRSIPGTPDLGQIAESYGGGGHPNAAGFHVSVKTFFGDMLGD